MCNYAHCSSGNGECLDDSPIGGRLNASALEGLNFGADAQCRAIHGPTARLCPVDFAVTVILILKCCINNVNITYVV